MAVQYVWNTVYSMHFYFNIMKLDWNIMARFLADVGLFVFTWLNVLIMFEPMPCPSSRIWVLQVKADVIVN